MKKINNKTNKTFEDLGTELVEKLKVVGAIAETGVDANPPSAELGEVSDNTDGLQGRPGFDYAYEKVKANPPLAELEVNDNTNGLQSQEVIKDEFHCLFPNCYKEAKSRGLCINHYSAAANLVKQGRTTWLTLESSNKCNTVSKTKKSKVSGWFMA